MKMDMNCGYVRYGRGYGQLRLAGASYGNGGASTRMGYAILDSPFGKILAAATGRGLTWVGVHESSAYLQAELRTDYPSAEIASGDSESAKLGRDILGFAIGDTAELEVPVDIRATPFQAAVWSELCAIARGETRSYGEIARRIGRASASRAVGHANGSNPIAIVIPCHRAIGADGSLTGYRWGLEYKRRLLKHEGALMRGEAAIENRAALPFR